MYLYNSEGKRVRYDLNTRIGGELYGNIYIRLILFISIMQIIVNKFPINQF